MNCLKSDGRCFSSNLDTNSCFWSFIFGLCRICRYPCGKFTCGHISLSWDQLVPCPLSFSMEVVHWRTLPACRKGTTDHRDVLDWSMFKYNHLGNQKVTKMFPSNHFSPISLFLWALIEAYLTVPRNPAAARAGLTSPAALVYCRARPKSSM